MKVAERMIRIPPSGTINMAEKAIKMEREGHEVLHLEVGEPDFDTPEHIKKAAYQALKNGFTHYTSSRGIFELREAISKDLKKREVEADPNTEILVTPGAKHAIYCACQATLNQGDEVLVLSPSWTTFYICIQAAEAKPVEVPTEEGYSLNEDLLKERVTSHTKLIIINSPNNPTGGVLTRKEIKVIADLAKDYDLLVLSDEIYDRLVYDNFKLTSIASLNEMRDRTITINGFSKTYAMTGWRLGYAVANKTVIEAMQRIQQATTTCPASFVQMAGLEALMGPQDCIERMVKEYDERRKVIVNELNKIPEITCPTPKGAFYVFPDVSSVKMTSSKIVEELLKKEKVCSTAGSVFGSFGESHIRFSYATSVEIILKAMGKLREFVEKLM